MKHIFSRLMASLAALSLLLPVPLPAAAAQSPAKAAMPARPLQLPLARRGCYLEAAKVWDTGVTMDVVQANYAYADCLEALAVHALESWYSPESRSEFLGAETPRAYLDRLLSQLDNLGYLVETGLADCAPSCGSMWQMSASGSQAEFLETLLRRIAERLVLESDQADKLDDPRWKTCWDEPKACDQKWLNES